MASFFEAASGQFRCPGCDRVIDISALPAGARFKCAKCKKLLKVGPHLYDPRYKSNWRMGRTVLLVACIAATVWCVTLGYSFGSQTGQWMAGFGGAMVVWSVAVGCIALAAVTTQNNGVLVGVSAVMAGVALFFIQRLGQKVGYDMSAWEQYRYYEAWAPGLIGVGAALLVAAFVVHTLHRSL